MLEVIFSIWKYRFLRGNDNADFTLIFSILLTAACIIFITLYLKKINLKKNYQRTIDYLYMALPMFQRIGAAAFKKDLTNTIALCEHLGNPQHKFKSIHVGGTNGKGSSSHMLASVLQEAGYKTGLYTSPHLKDFTERIRINGESVSEQFVVDFVARIKPQIEFIKPSFFEITVVMAFEYFAQQKVDVAVIEVGMGGRLDSTNVIMPVLSLITNIGTDHQEFLGDTPQKIAFEKAGIIKKEVPVVISEYQAEVADVFMKKAQEKNAAIYFAANEITCVKDARGIFLVTDTVNQNSILTLDLAGNYQQKNLPGVLKSLRLLQDIGFQITAEQIQNGLAHVVRNTNLKGRWQQIGSNPLSICDTGHNLEGIQEVLQQIAQQHFETLHIVWGSVKDKDIAAILSLLPKDAKYYFCQAKIPRAMDAADLAKMAAKQGLKGVVVPDVNEALASARRQAKTNDMIFIGGSTFVVAELKDL